VRQGKWKLVSRYREEWELYDLEADRTELTNLAARHPGKAARVGALAPDQLKKGGVRRIPG
jgi:hypothetical protein